FDVALSSGSRAPPALVKLLRFFWGSRILAAFIPSGKVGRVTRRLPGDVGGLFRYSTGLTGSLTFFDSNTFRAGLTGSLTFFDSNTFRAGVTGSLTFFVSGNSSTGLTGSPSFFDSGNSSTGLT